ncbi:MAG: hypothetical protein ACKVOO_08285 [Burkholderiaceae bacterium]
MNTFDPSLNYYPAALKICQNIRTAVQQNAQRVRCHQAAQIRAALSEPHHD